MASTRERILEVARELLLAGGPDALSMREVARQVGVSATALYRHFDGRPAILEAVVARGSALLVSELRKALAARGARARLVRTGYAYLRFAFAQPRYYQVLFSAWEDAPPVRPGTPRDHGEGLAFLLERVGECVAEGLLPPDVDALEIALYLWSVCHGAASLYLAGGGRHVFSRARYSRLSRRLVDRAVAGLLSHP